MKNLNLIVAREFSQYTKTTAYKLISLLMPVFLVGIFLLPAYLKKEENQALPTEKIFIYTPSQVLFDQIAQTYQDWYQIKSPAKPTNLTRYLKTNPFDSPTLSLAKQLAFKKIQGFVVIENKHLTGSEKISIVSLLKLKSKRALKHAVSEAIKHIRLQNAGLNNADLASILKDTEVNFNEMKEAKEDPNADKNIMKYILPYILAMVIYMSLIANGIAVMRSVVEEKSSRLVDVIISCVRPFTLMAGKIIGIGLAGILQIVIWASIGGLIHQIIGQGASPTMGKFTLTMANIPPIQMFYFVAYFILGFVLYASFYAAIGAMASSEHEANQMAMPVTFLLVIPIVLMSNVIEQPGSMLATGLSFFPFFTPILMFLRVNISSPPIWQIGFSFALMLTTIVAVMWAAAKFYRVGILMTGKWPGFRTFLRFMRS